VNAALLPAFGAAILNAGLSSALPGLSPALRRGTAHTLAFVAFTAAMYDSGTTVLVSPGASDAAATLCG